MARARARHKEEAAGTPLATWFLRLGFVSLAAIILLFTPYTNNLDDIKVTLQYWIGPVLVCLYIYLYTQGHVRPIPKIPFYCIVGYMAVMVLSILFCPYPWLGLRQFGFQFSLVGFFLVMAGTIINRRNLHDAVWFFVLMGFATSAFGFFHYFGGFNFIQNELISTRGQQTSFGQLVYTLSRTKDMLSTILNRDFFASFLVFLYPLAISAFIVTNNVKSRIFIAVTMVMMFFCVYLGLSKDSFAAFGISLSAYAILYWRFCRYKRLNIPYWPVWLAGLAVWTGTLIYLTWGHFSRIIRHIDTGIESRSIIWGGGIGIWLDNAKNFIIGGGPGHFRVLFPEHRRPDYFLHDISNVTLFAHNRYIDLLAEEGILGFIVYMALIAAIFFYSFMVLIKCKDGDQRVYQLGVLSSVLGLLLTNIFSPNVRWTVVAVNFWAVMGLGIGNYEFWKWGELEPPKRRIRAPIKPAFATLLGICGLFTLWSFYYGYVHFAGAYRNNEGVKLMDTVERVENLPPQTKQRFLLSAIENFNRATELNPTFLTSYYKVAHCYNQLAALNSADPEENYKYQKSALDAYKNLGRYAKDYAEIHYNLGIVNFILYNLKQEEAYKQESLKAFIEAGRQSNKIIVQFRLAQAYRDNGELDKASEIFQRIATLPLQRDPNEAQKDQYYKDQAPYALLETYQLKKDYQAAEQLALSMFEKNPGDFIVIRMLTTLYQMQGASQSLIDFLKRVLETNPTHTTARLEMARLLEEQGDIQGARQHIEIALFFEPANPTIRSRLEALKEKQS